MNSQWAENNLPHPISISPASMVIAPQQRLDAYDPMALIYNRTIAEDFCRRAFPVIERLLLSQLPRRARILDLCCGSGQMARELTRCGYEVVGLDGSEKMIGFARTNAPEAVLFLADARAFSTSRCFDAVLSTFNSFAHASTISELEAIFRNVRAALKPDALFLFDISMEEAYTSKWRGSFGDVQEDVAWIVRPTYDAETKIARNDVTIFQRNSSSWHRTDLSISQRCYSEQEIRAALSAAGFQKVASYDAERDLAMQKEAGRRFFLCK